MGFRIVFFKKKEYLKNGEKKALVGCFVGFVCLFIFCVFVYVELCVTFFSLFLWGQGFRRWRWIQL
ncbi:hypothetical protein LZ24_02984 [Desulfobotulus alkaliphilus]|uniref:Uncharacterized protein n=1 Tax=Desulfobotulus alkaliphilus TaxID=622671 RepID=A0A562R9Q8_9BACT|nr:hypothetical protein LZ24_02984 [Desulfobotulus alkaliphilus]